MEWLKKMFGWLIKAKNTAEDVAEYVEVHELVDKTAEAIKETEDAIVEAKEAYRTLKKSLRD